MDGNFMQPAQGPGAEPRFMWASFAPNGSSDPAAASNQGPPGLRTFTTTYAATGAFTVTLPVGWVPAANRTILVSAQAESLTEHFAVMTVGAFNPTTRQFVIQAHRNGTGRDVAANAGARIHFGILFNESTGG